MPAKIFAELSSLYDRNAREMGLRPKLFAAADDVRGFQVRKAFQRKLFNGEARHRRPDDDRFSKCLLVKCASAGQKPDESACEGVAGTCRVLDQFERKRRGGEIAVTAEHQAAVFTLLDDDARWPHFQKFARGDLEVRSEE